MVKLVLKNTCNNSVKFFFKIIKITVEITNIDRFRTENIFIYSGNTQATFVIIYLCIAFVNYCRVYICFFEILNLILFIFIERNGNYKHSF